MKQDLNYLKKTDLSCYGEPDIWNDKLRVATISHIYYINLKEIIRIQSVSNYSKLFFADGRTLLVSKGLGYFDELLTDSHFTRVHRTHIVNLLFVDRYLQGDIPKIGLTNNELLPVARRKKKVFRQKMMSYVSA